MTLKLAFVISAVDKATGTVRNVNRSIDKMTEPAKRVRASFGALIKESRFDRVASSVGVLRERMGGLMQVGKQAVGMFVMVAAAAGGMYMGMQRVTTAVDQTLKTAKLLNLPIEQFQRLGYAAKLNGSSQEEMGESLRFLSRNMVAAINGGKEMQQWFGRVGISVEQLKKMNVAEVYGAIADKFVEVGDQGGNAEKKIAFMQATMGRSGTAMKHTLELGRKGLKEMGDEADRLGAVVDGKTANSMEAFNDNVDRLKTSLFGVMVRITSVALPALESIVLRMTDWAVANREMIGTEVAGFVKRVVAGLPPFIKAVVQIGTALGMLFGTLNAVAQALGGWDTVIVAISATLVGKLVWALALVGKAIFGVGAALAMTPFGWFMAAVAALAAGVYLIYKHWGPIKDWFAALWDGIKSGFTASIDFIIEKVMSVVRWVSDKIVALNDMTPNWVKKFTPGGMVLNAAAGAVAPLASPVASPIAGGNKQDVNVGGTLKIQIDTEGRARVVDMRSANAGMDMDVYTGRQMVSP